MRGRAISVHVSPKKVAVFLLLVALLLTLASGVAQIANVLIGAGRPPLLALLFVGEDASLPSWFSAVMLLTCSVLLAMIAQARRVARQRYAFHWGALAAIFLYLSIDEAISVHEKLSPLGREMLNLVGAGDFIRRAWVVPAVIVLLALAVLYARFFLRLTQRIRLLFLAALGLFFGGAVGLELSNDLYVYFNGGVGDLSAVENLTRTVVLPHVEEFFEMLGLIVLIYALLLHAREHFGAYEFRLKE